MKKITSVLLFLAIAVTSSYAQNRVGDINFRFGEKIEDQKGTIVKIVGETEGRIYALGLKGKKDYYINTFSSEDMSLLSNERLVLPEIKDKDLEFEEMLLVGTKLYVIGSFYDRRNKESNLVAIEISAEGKLTGNEHTLFSIQVDKHAERGAYFFRSSDSEDQLLAMHVSIQNKKDMIQYQVKLMDENMTVSMDHKEQLPYEEKKGGQFGIEDYDVSPYGDVFIVINESYRDKKLKKHIENFELHSFKKDNDYQKEVLKLDASDNYIINCKMRVGYDNVVQMVGFYAETTEKGRTKGKLKGIYNFNVNSVNNTVANQKFNEFDLETRTKILGERRANKGKDLNPLYSINNIILRTDGGVVVLSEYQTILVGRSSGIGPLAFTPITYRSNEIIITSLDLNGNLEWSNVVPKEQTVSTTVLSIGFISFVGTGSGVSVGSGFVIPITQMGKGPEYIGAVPIYENDKLTVLFNDNEKNIGETDIEKIKRMTSYNKAIPTAFQFDKNGVMTRIDPKEAAKDQLIMRPNILLRKSNTEMIIFTSRRSEERLSRMTIGN
ncbi:MAG: hypothetical protein WDZ45_00770 [Flavobacteriaceae bacterium]